MQSLPSLLIHGWFMFFFGVYIASSSATWPQAAKDSAACEQDVLCPGPMVLSSLFGSVCLYSVDICGSGNLSTACFNEVAPKGVPMAVPALPAPPSNQPRWELEHGIRACTRAPCGHCDITVNFVSPPKSIHGEGLPSVAKATTNEDQSCREWGGARTCSIIGVFPCESHFEFQGRKFRLVQASKVCNQSLDRTVGQLSTIRSGW